MSQKSELRSLISGNKIEDLTSYATRAEVAESLSVSVATVRRLERRGVLHPVVDAEGTHRFHPAEVEHLSGESGGAAELETANAPPIPCALCGRAVDDVSTAARLLNSTMVPREKADRYLFEVLDRQAKRISELEGQSAETWRARERAADFTNERALELASATKDTTLQDKILERAMGTFERMTGKVAPSAPGAPGDWLAGLSREQLTTLLDVPDMWGASQLAAVRAALARLPTPEAPPEAPPVTTPTPNKKEKRTNGTP
jgi:hypothetical protein